MVLGLFWEAWIVVFMVGLIAYFNVRMTNYLPQGFGGTKEEYIKKASILLPAYSMALTTAILYGMKVVHMGFMAGVDVGH